MRWVWLAHLAETLEVGAAQALQLVAGVGARLGHGCRVALACICNKWETRICLRRKGGEGWSDGKTIELRGSVKTNVSWVVFVFMDKTQTTVIRHVI